MENAIKASRLPIQGHILNKSFKKAFEMLEDSPTEGLLEPMRIGNGRRTIFRL